ncbi:phosphatidylserine decarboxylase [Mycolicibacterium madagascariense]|uniref:Phosphatidylserine decarboxylase n=1 Tax=Mycolicibacterium madagascariense TaxID=212765 RepID=A0A7I7XFY7_9MYCO|nr:phosphatidylserine decarboxylase family protein [Mycolicibacterium madagascariense]MCV7013860.1 phosphatidylserine decarboxylase family protein [Mycolicibacterium madagascariense]BBZ28102.1 phosphatidylserine decarboxylase [Mycolicibacterium madagascariense]
MSIDRTHPDPRRQGGWLPSEQDGLEAWLRGHRDRAQENGERPWHPVLVEFQRLIDDDPVVRMYLEKMIAQVPSGRTYRDRHVEDLPQLLRLINEVLTVAPEFGPNAVVTPLGAIFDWSMGTPAGHSAFRDPRVNAMLKKLLTAWCEFLSGPDSRYVLNDSSSGWLGSDAQKAVGLDEFEYDPDAEYGGFTSWNDFFTRTFKPGRRPVAHPDDDSVIVSACESTPYRIATDVSRQDRFWVKGQPYSVADLLANDPVVDELVGGTVYQAFLSAMNFHRWHSPISGTIERAYLLDGTYYSESDEQGPDALQPTQSQSYLAHVSARAVIVINADNPVIGRMAFVAVGMSEVSSCLIDDAVHPGAHVTKGQELGYFQFGGSTHCLIFRPGAIGEFALPAIPQPNDPNAPLVLVNSHLATAAAGGEG